LLLVAAALVQMVRPCPLPPTSPRFTEWLAAVLG
jgi:hypothetical protein